MYIFFFYNYFLFLLPFTSILKQYIPQEFLIWKKVVLHISFNCQTSPLSDISVTLTQDFYNTENEGREGQHIVYDITPRIVYNVHRLLNMVKAR